MSSSNVLLFSSLAPVLIEKTILERQRALQKHCETCPWLGLAAGVCMPFSVAGLAGDVLVALDEFVRKADIFRLGEFAFVVGLA